MLFFAKDPKHNQSMLKVLKIAKLGFALLLGFITCIPAQAHWPGHEHKHEGQNAHSHAAHPPKPEDTAKVIDKGLYPELSEGQTYQVKGNGPITVGFGEASILPDFPMVMSYGSDKPTKAFYDTAKVKVMLFEVDSIKLAWLEYDVIAVQNEQAEKIKDTIARNTGLKKRHIIVSATHNHSYGRTHKEKVYRLMAGRGIQATQRALNSRFPARIGFGKRKIPRDLNLNRAEANGLANPLLYVIKVTDTAGHLRGVHYNYGSHPTVFTEWGSSRGKIGPNWPGYVNHFVQQRKRLDLLYKRYKEKNGIATNPFVMFSEGSAGDQQPRNTDVFLHGQRQPGQKVFMERLARQVVQLLENTDTRRKADLHFQAQTHKMGMKNGDRYMTLLQTLEINQTALVTIPGELNVELGQKFEKHSPHQNNILITNSDDYTGYIVREEMALEQVTYQSKGIPFNPFFGERMVNEALKMVKPGYEADQPANPEELYGAISGKVDYSGPNKVAIGAMRKPATPNYGGGFFGQRTVVNPNGTFKIDSLTPGRFYLYVMETNADNPAPDELKSGFSDIRTLTYGQPVTVSAQQTTRNVNFRFEENSTNSPVQDFQLAYNSLSANGYEVQGNVSFKGELQVEDVIEIRVYPAKRPYKYLELFMNDPLFTVEANKHGYFTIESLPKGSYQIAAYLDVNHNNLVETGIDQLTDPLKSPIIQIGDPSYIKRH
jgi:hypothetical protein